MSYFSYVYTELKDRKFRTSTAWPDGLYHNTPCHVTDSTKTEVEDNKQLMMEIQGETEHNQPRISNPFKKCTLHHFFIMAWFIFNSFKFNKIYQWSFCQYRLPWVLRCEFPVKSGLGQLPPGDFNSSWNMHHKRLLSNQQLAEKAYHMLKHQSFHVVIGHGRKFGNSTYHSLK